MGDIKKIKCKFDDQKQTGKNLVIEYDNQMLEPVAKSLSKNVGDGFQKKFTEQFDILHLSYGMEPNGQPETRRLVEATCQTKAQNSDKYIECDIKRLFDIYIERDKHILDERILNVNINVSEENLENLKKKSDTLKYLKDVKDLEVLRFCPTESKDLAKDIELSVSLWIGKSKTKDTKDTKDKENTNV